MNNARRIALILALVAGVICLAAFFFTETKDGGRNYMILLPGVLAFGYGISSYYTSKPKDKN